MTNNDFKKEFERWIDAGRPPVWVKGPSVPENDWIITEKPEWNEESTYVINDEQAELRILQYDKPSTKFQFKNSKGEWENCEPAWSVNEKYRVKPTEWYEDPKMIGKLMIVWDFDKSSINVEKFKKYDQNSPYPFIDEDDVRWMNAEPIKPSDCYGGENNG
jgi:hypothetical protein